MFGLFHKAGDSYLLSSPPRMTYNDLKNFILIDMQMQHVYQPVMLIELLKNNGEASETQIAKAILGVDPVQQRYYEDKVRNMVGKVLNKNGITEREKSTHRLLGYEQLTDEQKTELLALLRSRLSAEELKRGETFWKHRATDREPISGSIRYEVLKRAKGRCECCGASIDDRPIDIDHIVPRSKTGDNDISNYQALCWLCNANKGNRDNTDFRGINAIYEHRQTGCLFCDVQVNDRQRIVTENTLAFAVRDGFPVTEGHTLLIPKRHAADYFELSQAEINAINQLMVQQQEFLQKSDKSIEGFNIGMNCGEVAGQTIFHCHVHLIPRRKGDVENPRGGVRHVIAGKGYY
jgi:diadenosine tetraphosphate (Ap4A) HIT family hydrolase